MSHPIFKIAAVVAACFASVGAQAQVSLLGLSASQELVRFAPDQGQAAVSVAITGLGSGERLLGIDLRPTDGRVYGISSANNLYTLDAFTGQASLLRALSGASLNGAGDIGIDFNPVADFAGSTSLRVTTGAGNNYAVNANTGVVGNTASNIGAGHTGVAYANSVVGVAPTTTGLYYINSSTDQLEFAPGSFNSPTISVIGNLNLSSKLLSANGFDIASNGMAYAALNLADGSGQTGIYGINLSSGAATKLSTYNGTLLGLTQSAAAVPEPDSAVLMGLGLAAMFAFSRRAKKA